MYVLKIKKWFYKNKSYIITFFIGGIFFSTISVSAAIMIAAKEVSLSTPKTSKTNVQDSLDELYDLVTYGNVSASQMLSGTTALSNGKKITGTISSKGATTFTPSTSNQTIAAGQYLSGAQTIKGDSNLVAGNIKSGVSLFGVKGTYTGSGSKILIGGYTSSRRNSSLNVSKDDYIFCVGPYAEACRVSGISVQEYSSGGVSSDWQFKIYKALSSGTVTFGFLSDNDGALLVEVK